LLQIIEHGLYWIILLLITICIRIYNNIALIELITCMECFKVNMIKSKAII
jgi:hypothetical protein